MLLRQELLRGFFGWITYSLIRSERRDHPDTDWRLFDFDQTQVLGVLASYQLGHGWDVGARFRYTTGFPRTPVIGAYLRRPPTTSTTRSSARTTRSGSRPSISSTRASSKSFVYRRVKLNVFLDVQNVTNRKNPEEIIYNYNFTLKRLHHRLPDAGGAGRAGGVLMRRSASSGRAPGRSRLAGGRLQARPRRAAVARHRAALPGGARDARPRRPRTAWSPTTRWSVEPERHRRRRRHRLGAVPQPQSAGQRATTSAAAPASTIPDDTTAAAPTFTAPLPGERLHAVRSRDAARR